MFRNSFVQRQAFTIGGGASGHFSMKGGLMFLGVVRSKHGRYGSNGGWKHLDVPVGICG